jgi:signal transduction histidine kinase
VRALTETAAAGWPLAASLAVAVAGQIRSARRRVALNEALHELRRPLQAMLLARPALPGSTAALALAALTRLDREINGGVASGAPTLVSCRSQAEEAVARWSERAVSAGTRIGLRWSAGGATVFADPAELAGALDNLLLNALEHGSPPVRIDATVRSGRLRLAVIDGGGRSRDDGPGPDWLSGRRRRGHGLKLVRRFATRQGGRFFLDRRARGTVAVLELPVAGPGGRRAA